MIAPSAGSTAPALGAIDLAVIALYVLALLVVALRRGRRGRDEADFLLAGRTLTLPAFVATLVSTWYGGVLGVGEYSYLFGLSNWIALGGPYYLAGLVFALLIAGRARESDLVTVPERLLSDHGPAVGALGALLVVVGVLPAAYLLMLGVLVERSLGVSQQAGILLAAALSFVVVLRGGFASVVRANVLQFLLMYGGFLLLLPLAWSAAGGLEGLDTLPASHRSWDGGLGVQAVLVWYVIALQTLVEPSFYQRCFAARTPATAQRGVLVSVLFWVVFDGLTTTTGMFARVLLPELADPIEAYPALGELLLPVGLLGLFYVGLIATVMSTVESLLFVGATTLGFDVPRAWAAARGRLFVRDHDAERRATRLGLLVVTLAATGLALASESAVALWKGIGSVVTPALLLPLMGGFLPRFRAGARATLVSMLGATATALVFMAPLLAGWEAPLFGVEPIFPALAFSLACHLPAWLAPRSRAN